MKRREILLRLAMLVLVLPLACQAQPSTAKPVAIERGVLSAGDRQLVDAGGLIGYGSTTEVWRYAATYVDKILKGAKPGDLPIEQPRNIELVVNLKTSKALGLALPPAFRSRIDRVVE